MIPLRFSLTVLVLTMVSIVSGQSDFLAKGVSYVTSQSGSFESLDLNSDELRVSSWHKSKSSGATHIYFQQTHQEIDVFNATGSVHFNKEGEVFKGNNELINIKDYAIQGAESIDAASAIRKVSKHFGYESDQQVFLKSAAQGREKLQFHEFPGFASGEIHSKLIWVQKDNRLVLAWNVQLEHAQSLRGWWIQVDASSGEIIGEIPQTIECNFDHVFNEFLASLHKKKDRRSNTTSQLKSYQPIFVPNSYNAFEIPTEAPTDGDRSIIVSPWNDDASPFGWHDDDGAAGAEYPDTRGNNVHAQEDRDANNIGGIRPDGGGTLDFDFPLDTSMAPSTYIPASVTNLFYMNNIMHDVMWQYGFDEASGNFQSNNYGNGGVQGDFVNADAQDGSGTNNATFSRTIDGQNPRMTMFEWVANSVDFTIDSPPGIAGNYTATGAGFGIFDTPIPISGSLVLAVPNEGCSALTNAAAINGNIAVIDRGNCQFDNKAWFAEQAGAIATLVCNNVAGAPIVMGSGDDGIPPTVHTNIPATMLSLADCNLIKANLPATATIDWTATFHTDSDLDNGIIAHEYGHGVSIRLTGGANNANCLTVSEQMGEGWSDYFALMTTIEPGDLPSDPRGVGTYSGGEDIDGEGIRPFRYTTDMSINPHTYDNIKSGLSVPHGIGSVWTVMLWEVTANLIQKYGFDTDIYDGAGGNNVALQLVIEGLKMQPCQPGFVNGRDAILDADTLLNAGANACEIWRGFAKRGLGVSAIQGSANNLTDGTEAFDVPTGCAIDPCDNFDIVYNNETIPDATDDHAENLVKMQGTVDVTGASTVNLKSGFGMVVEDEFDADTGTTMTVNIGPCQPTNVINNLLPANNPQLKSAKE